MYKPRIWNHLSVAAVLASGSLAKASEFDAENALVSDYCVMCHSDQSMTAGFSLEAFDVSRAEDKAPLAEKMIRKLRAGMMPPSFAPKPDPAEIADLARTLEERIDEVAARNPNPGARTFQRLNRAEYSRSIRELLALDVDVTAFLPPDTISHGFDNVADVQTMSPTLMEGYLRAAGKISRLAVGDPRTGATEATYKVPRTASQMDRVDGSSFRHARRNLHGPSLPRGRRVRVQDDAPRKPDRAALWSAGEGRADRDLDRGRAGGAPRHRPDDGRVRSERDESREPASLPQGRSASGVGRLSPEVRESRRRFDGADRPYPRRHDHRNRLRSQDPPAPPRVPDQRTAQRDRSLGHREPPESLHLPAHHGRRRASLRPARSFPSSRPKPTGGL